MGLLVEGCGEIYRQKKPNPSFYFFGYTSGLGSSLCQCLQWMEMKVTSISTCYRQQRKIVVGVRRSCRGRTRGYSLADFSHSWDTDTDC